MNQNQIAAYYRQVSAQGANRVGLVVRLYDSILEDFRIAKEAFDAGDIERRTTRLNHSLLVISELEGVLDYERGGLVARRLKDFYAVTRAMIIEANIRCSREKLDRLAELYVPLRQAWRVVEQEVATGKARLSSEPVPRTSRISPGPSTGAEAFQEDHTSWWNA